MAGPRLVLRPDLILSKSGLGVIGFTGLLELDLSLDVINEELVALESA